MDLRLKKFSMGLMSGLLAGILMCLTPNDSITFKAVLQFWLGSPSWRNYLLPGLLHLLINSGKFF